MAASSVVHVSIMLNFEPTHDSMADLVKNEEDPIKIEGCRVVTTLYIVFSDAQGHRTPQSLFRSNRSSIPSEILWMSSLTARIEKIQSKKAEGGHTMFPSITLCELSVTMESRVQIRSGPRPNAEIPPPQ